MSPAGRANQVFAMSKELDLRPYLGKIILCRTLEELKSECTALTGQDYPFDDDDPEGGRYIQLNGENNDVRWLVWGNDFKCVVHELCHVLLHTFGKIGHDPTDGDGEPFCYMLSALMDEAES